MLRRHQTCSRSAARSGTMAPAPLARPTPEDTMRLRTRLILCALLGTSRLAFSQPAAAPVRQLAVNIPPYYSAAASPATAPKVAVDPAYDALLASIDPAAIRKARDAIAAHPDLVRPETLIVLAIRLYDTGQRDDAVTWYYAGRDRFLTMEAVLDMRSLRLARQAQAVDSFIDAVGPAIDGYALCDVDRHQKREDDAIAWVAAHPYKPLGYADLPALEEDRNAALVNSINRMREASANNALLIVQPEMRARFAEARAANQADARYCWK